MSKVKSLTGERWVKIDFGHATKNKDYHISSFGRIKRVNHGDHKEKIIQGSIDNRGRKILNVILEGGKYASRYIHHEVAQNFVRKKDSTFEKIVHLDYNPLNNHHKNLKWVDDSTWKIHRRQNPYRKLYARKSKSS